MKPRTMILMVVAIVCGLAAMYMTNRLLADKAKPEAPTATVKVLVSKQKIGAWSPIKKPEEVFEVKEVPEGTYSPKCITDFKDLKDQSLKQPLNEQMPVTRDDLVTDATAGLVGMLQPGQRAVAIKVTPESLVGGFVLPGSHVDVMFIKKRGDTDSETRIILQNMLVLAVDTTKTREDGRDTILGTTATLAATPEEAEQLSLAQSLGDLRLLLRTQMDASHQNYKPVTLGALGHQQHPHDDGTAQHSDDSDTGTSGVATLPSLPHVGASGTPEKAPEMDPAKTHVMRINNGDSHNKVIFTWDKDHNRWEGDEPDKKPDAARPADAPRPDAAPTPAKAPAGAVKPGN
jgi:pilus assembly protein CpaB